MPLAFILTITAIKDGLEDYRRGVQDTELNNSAATRLARGDGWMNVNVPRDGRTWFEKLTGTGNAPDKPTRGVRKLRARENDSEISIASTLVGKNGGPAASQTKLYDPTHPATQSKEDRFNEFGTPHQYPPSIVRRCSRGLCCMQVLTCCVPRAVWSEHFTSL